uniref:BTB domain-containing protein n=1 Tax=Panagrolaimus sp. ES5 TaxID=591445 RepID=A0AC34EZE6_9BILA
MDEEKENLYELQMERFKVFKAQIPDPEKSDIVFDFHGKNLYAHKFMISTISPTFDSMLASRWAKPNEPVQIRDYSFDDFKEFLTFIYSGKCQFTDENIFIMVDIAEFYGVGVFKKACDKYLEKIELNLNNVFQMLKKAEKYSIVQLKKSLYIFVSNNLLSFLQSEQFLNLEEFVVKYIVKCVQKTSDQETLLEWVYKWTENQAINKQKLNKNLDLNDAMKKEMTDFLPFFTFAAMDSDFLDKFIVKIIGKNGKVIKGQLQCPNVNKVAAAILSRLNITCTKENSSYCYWKTRQPKPTEASQLIKNENIDWYLIYDHDGDIAYKHRSMIIRYDYLLAEMVAEDHFEIDGYCKIEIV